MCHLGQRNGPPDLAVILGLLCARFHLGYRLKLIYLARFELSLQIFNPRRQSLALICTANHPRLSSVYDLATRLHDQRLLYCSLLEMHQR